MVYLSDIMDPGLLSRHVTNGLVTRRNHDSLPLSILNYTPECQYSRAWDDVTRKCRGLIYDRISGEVVARPFEKFGNWDESGYPFPPSGPALRMEKMDGSLGILYQTVERVGCFGSISYAIATRGSFHSEQAAWATEFFNGHMKEDYAANGSTGKFFNPHPSKTYLFEIIYPENRIVVDYGEHEGLTLLDVIDNETGFSDTDEFDNCRWPDKVVRQHIPGFDSGQVVDIPQGGEGFVFLWPAKNFRTKMKSAEYVEIHRMISRLSEKTVWQALVTGKTRDEIKVGLPEEFHVWVDGVIDEITNNASEILDRVSGKFDDLNSRGLTESRKDFALAIKDDPDRKYLFLMLDGNSVYVVALADSKPTRETNLTREV